MMVGAAAFAKKLAKKNHSLADYRFLTSKSDEVRIDMLVGNEHRYRIISPKALPIQLYGMFCPRTVFGDLVMSGTIPGPGSISSNISNNVVTLFNISCSRSTHPTPEEVPEPNELNTAIHSSSKINSDIQDKDSKIREKFQINNDIPLVSNSSSNCLVIDKLNSTQNRKTSSCQQG